MELKPGGYHVMLMDLKAALPKDSTVPLTLVFKDAKGVESKLELKVPVATAPAPATESRRALTYHGPMLRTDLRRCRRNLVGAGERHP